MAKLSHQSQAWLIWGLAAAFYFFDYLARVAPGVMHLALQKAFSLSEFGFTSLTASFYIPYILMQIPVGLIVDRVRIRYLLTAMSLITSLACLMFAAAHGLWSASLARVLIGFSAAFAFTSALRLATAWFPPMKLGLLAGMTQALGMLGASAGQAPLSLLVSYMDWRQAMVLVSGFFIVLALLLYRYVKDAPKLSTLHPHPTTSMSIWASLLMVISNPQAWLNALYAGFLYASTAVSGESIGPAFLAYGHDIPIHSAAFAIGLIFIGWGFGGPLFGWISDKIQRRKGLMLASAFCGLALTTVLVCAPHLTALSASLLLFFFGLTNCGVALAYALSTEIMPRQAIGTSIAFTNMMSILIGASLQPIVGFLVDRHSGLRAFNAELLRLPDFQAGLAILPLFAFIACLLVLGLKETHCKRLE